MSSYTILDYLGGRDLDVAALILAIQNDEADIDLSIDEQPDLLDIAAAYRDGGFWVAQVDNVVVGTIGVLRYGNSGILKRFFVQSDFRGATGPASALYAKVVVWALTQGLAALYLDTPSVAARAHAFYRIKGFEPVDRSALPDGYDFPDRDSLIFRLVLSDAP